MLHVKVNSGKCSDTYAQVDASIIIALCKLTPQPHVFHLVISYNTE